MAEFDIRPYSSAHGGHMRVSHGYLEGTPAAGAFEKGDVVQIVAASGRMDEAADDPNIKAAPPGAVGVAAEGAQQIADARGDGTIANSEDEPVAYYPFDRDNYFVTRNITNNAPTALVPTVANIGDLATLSLTAGVWSLDVGGTNEDFEIVQLLDADGKDAVANGTTAVAAVFRLSTTA